MCGKKIRAIVTRVLTLAACWDRPYGYSMRLKICHVSLNSHKTKDRRGKAKVCVFFSIQMWGMKSFDRMGIHLTVNASTSPRAGTRERSRLKLRSYTWASTSCVTSEETQIPAKRGYYKCWRQYCSLHTQWAEKLSEYLCVHKAVSPLPRASIWVWRLGEYMLATG